jgi:hypothetical protein
LLSKEAVEIFKERGIGVEVLGIGKERLVFGLHVFPGTLA